MNASLSKNIQRFGIEFCTNRKEAYSQAIVKRRSCKVCNFLVRKLLTAVPILAIFIFVAYGLTFAVSRPFGYIFGVEMSVVIGFLMLKLLTVICSAYQRVKAFPIQPSIKTLPQYQDSNLMKRAMENPVAVCYGRNETISQPLEGYCGSASVCTIMVSIPSFPFLRFAAMPRPYTLQEMGVYIRTIGTLLSSADCFKDVPSTFMYPESFEYQIENVETFSEFSYHEFVSFLPQLNDLNYRFVANFLRTPLFWSDQPTTASNFFSKLFAGHWSPMISYLEKEDLIYVADVNENFGSYMVPSRRMYEAISTLDSFNKSWRGIVRITIKKQK